MFPGFDDLIERVQRGRLLSDIDELWNSELEVRNIHRLHELGVDITWNLEKPLRRSMEINSGRMKSLRQQQ